MLSTHATCRQIIQLSAALLICSLLTAASLRADDSTIPAPFKGVWKVVKVESVTPFPKEFADTLRLEFTAKTLIVSTGQRTREFDVKFPTKYDKKSEKPAVFTMAETEGKKKGQIGRVLYLMAKDGKLTVCVPNGPDGEEDEPIKSFKGGKQSKRHLILVMEKMKVEKKEEKKEEKK